MHTGSGTRWWQLREDALAQKFHLNVCMTAPKYPQQMLLVFNEKRVNGPRGSYIRLLDLLLVEPFGEEVLKVANQAKGEQNWTLVLLFKALWSVTLRSFTFFLTIQQGLKRHCASGAAGAGQEPCWGGSCPDSNSSGNYLFKQQRTLVRGHKLHFFKAIYLLILFLITKLWIEINTLLLYKFY